MRKELKVMEFDKKQKLVDFVNSNQEKIEIQTISTSQVSSFDYSHFLWYYEK